MSQQLSPLTPLVQALNELQDELERKEGEKTYGYAEAVKKTTRLLKEAGKL